ncbi:hypothetical protein DV736_g1275, partial [Chaetothyriales sp. CBS 134916]
MTSVNTHIPEGYSPPFATLTTTDHTAWILIATALCMACFLFFCSIRVALRFTLSPGFEFDDYTCWAATGIAALQSSIVLGACAKGFGKSTNLLSVDELDSVQKLYYASNLFFILAVGMSKISVICLLHRIWRLDGNRKALYAGMAVVGAWAISSIFAIAFQCDYSHPWTMVDEKCPGIRTRWNVICALDIATEIGIFGLVIHLVYPLQMVLARKFTVAYIFSFRLLAIIFISFRLHTLSTSHRYFTTNPFLHLARYICWTQGQQAYVLITATVPAFRNLLKSLHTGFGGMSAVERSYGYGSQNNNSSVNASKNRHASGMDFKMTRLTRCSINDSKNRDQDTKTIFTNKNNATSVSVENPPDSDKLWSQMPKASERIRAETGEPNGNATETTSIGSNESRKMMIRKDVDWSVRTEPRNT